MEGGPVTDDAFTRMIEELSRQEGEKYGGRWRDFYALCERAAFIIEHDGSDEAREWMEDWERLG